MADYIEKHLNDLGYEYTIGTKGYEIQLQFDDGRKQFVYVSRSCDDVDDISFREIWSPACVLAGELNSEIALVLLENNYYRAIGAWIYNAETHTVSFSCKVPDHLTLEELEAILIAVASDADRLEQKLTKQDVL